MSDAAMPSVTIPSQDAGRAKAALPITLIVNTKARRGQEWHAQAEETLQRMEVPIEASHALEHPEKLEETLRQSVAKGAKMIVVGGGDGSLRTAAKVLAGTEIAMGVLPLGTVNDFARNLKIETEIEAACKVIAEGYTEQIDVGLANDEHFLITASLGFSALTQTVLSPQLKKMLGPLGYVTAGILALHKLRHLSLTLHSEKGDERMTAVQAGVINGHNWMGGAVEIPSLTLESGRLAFYAVPPRTMRHYLRMVHDLRHGRFFHTPDLRAFTTCDMTLQTDKPHHLVLDGDLAGKTPVRFRILPGALRVCVPAPETTAQNREE